MHMLRLFVLTGILLIVSVTLTKGTVRHVPTDYATIQEAIVAAIGTDTVLVDTGRYLEHIDFLGKNIAVVSGFAVVPDCSIILNTIIDADSVGSAVVMTHGETSNAVLMGFTITNGAGHLYEPGYGTFHVGGGIYMMNSSPTIKFNVITGNNTRDGGGGIFCDGGNPIIHRNAIVENYTTIAGCGAGILLINATGGVIDSNYVQYNHAMHGGGIALKHANPLVTRNVVSHNVAIRDGGGIRVYTQSTPSIINNTISHNCSDYDGGGVQVLENSSPVVMNNIISFTQEGGGISSEPDCSPALSYNLFYQNTGGHYVNCAPGLGDFIGDPVFVGGTPFDYHLTLLSAAINHGNPDPQYNDPDNTRNDCGAFYYRSPATPVVLAAFTASVSESGVMLHWTTASEIDCWAWMVQRLDNGIFRDLSPYIAGGGSSVEMRDYTYVDESAQPGNSYTYRLKQIDLDGTTTIFDPVTVTVNALALSYELQQNYPNPFNPTTAISYKLQASSHVSLKIYDTAGRLITTLVDGFREAGSHTIIWNAQGLPSAVYLCQMQAGGQVFNRQLALIK